MLFFARPSLQCSFAQLCNLRRLVHLIGYFLIAAMLPSTLLAQTGAATLSGTITDTGGALVAGVRVTITQEDTGVSVDARTNNAGIYNQPGLKPGRYRVLVEKEGFKQVDVHGLTLNVQDVVSRNFTLEIGGTSETIQVDGSQATVNTTDASVSTVIDRQFVENLPMNGRTFQTLIYLTPGVTLSAGSGESTNGAFAPGQFSANGQRGSANYMTVDGVSANIGTNAYSNPGNGAAGSTGSVNVLGGTNSLVSVDALQEFRIQTSTYSPEFGRTPGAQISIVTRSGTNTFHGALFDYFRNTVLDSTDWFADHNDLPKAAEQQNDFGGVLGGPIVRDKAFFFFSYEGLRLHQPQTLLSTVPDLDARQKAIAPVQPFLNAYPVPNGPEVLDASGNPSDEAQFNTTFSNPSTVDAYSLRIDHSVSKSLSLFGHYNYSPSRSVVRASSGSTANTVFDIGSRINTATAGATWTMSSHAADEVRVNYSTANGSTSSYMDTYGGGSAAPGASLFPGSLTYSDAQFVLDPAVGINIDTYQGKNNTNKQHQFNIVDTVSTEQGSHSLKFGVDYRRMSPLYSAPSYALLPVFLTMPDMEQGNAFETLVFSLESATFLFRNLSVFGQDSWRISPRLTMTYGLRWDVDFAPTTESGPGIPAVTGYSLTDLSNLALAPAGTPAYSTRFSNVAPRLAINYQLSTKPDWALVVRGGVGIYYDLSSSEAGNAYPQAYPYDVTAVNSGPFPTPPAVAAPPAIVPPNATEGMLIGSDPNLNLPYTLQWSFALEQALGGAQTLTVSYVGSSGRRLLATEQLTAPNRNYASAYLIGNAGNSNYNALQAQFQRRLSRGVQMLASYSWARSIDTGSYGAYTNGGFAEINQNRGDSDFDIRDTFSAALTYDVPTSRANGFAKALIGGWSTENIVQSRSAPPVDVIDSAFTYLTAQNKLLVFRPDVVPGRPFYLHGSEYPGDKALNPAAFTNPPVDPTTGNPLRQGDLGRNALRAFGLEQWDFAVHWDFPVREAMKVQFRAELFNVLNHPNFAAYNNDFNDGDPYFGQSTQMYGTSQSQAGGGEGKGGLSNLYQLGSPRSIQLALRFSF